MISYKNLVLGSRRPLHEIPQVHPLSRSRVIKCVLRDRLYAFPLQVATMCTPVYALGPIAIKMNICMSKHQMESGVSIVAGRT